ncbi:MAG: preprotein translocase subunit SecG [Candidatus Komeilibacteria bacterium RIFCSPLOWO2_01_FULL_52_15]|uniref:Protein-export membrane protein SecG n=2 Tax=Candidatus Komeiliibacteriota TaxID=1817908 RepID=A0A1G2BRG0_9BACT|nr:MAG: preprotein translocase subunit SecG [Candidatus Komeilibacteria bacterium RIFCSPHIGHO2_01_FULL_52_14]OGY91734.1 MAG: preprotein translocase subunit SecG [Candidatus Komeilibacteria bacterium RIFCSPLOWO2_01_FULL_52_15]
MKTALYILQVVVSLLLITSILIQSRGSGLGLAFGGSSAVYRTKRGAEKMIFRATIVLTILFMLISVAHLFI